MNFAASVKIVEVDQRDGLQNERETIAADSRSRW